MIITFAGHSRMVIGNDLKDLIRKTIIDNMKSERVTFYLGGYGDFDYACALIVKDLKREYPNIESVFVTPYIDSTRLQAVISSHLYDGNLYPNLENVPYRFAISKRNEFMVDQADLLICYVESNFGGAYKTLMHARRKNKRIVNLAEDK